MLGEPEQARGQVVALALNAWLHIPFARAPGAAALVTAASMLTAVEPLDGGVVASGPAGIAATVERV